MARRALTASFVLTPFAVALAMQGCTQDFSTFDPTGSGGGDTTTTASSSPTSGSTTTSSTTTTNVGPGGGEGGATTSGPGGGAGGPPTECETPAECDDGNPCTDDACTDGTCERTPVEDGPLVDNGEDCRTIECDGGVLVDEPNDDEDPADANPPCEETICVDGAPTPRFADDTVSCGPDPQFCDGEGICVGCDPAPPDQEECGEPTACSVPDCVDPGVCNPGFVDAGTPVGGSPAGDCQALACTGSSAAPGAVIDNTDTPADTACGNGVCTAGVPSTAVVANGMPCLVGTGVCDGVSAAATSCKVCRDTAAGGTMDAGCNAGAPICDQTGNGTCRACIDDVAGAGQDLGCSPTLPACDATANGGVGVCRECVTDVHCGAEVCDPDTDTCEACYSNGVDGADPGCDGATGLNPRCNEATRLCGGCVGSGDCADNPRGDDCNGNNGNPGQCLCDGDTDCEHDEATGPDCNMGTGVCQP